MKNSSRYPWSQQQFKAFSVIAFLAAGNAFAEDIYWVGGDGNFSDESSWSIVTLPGPSDSVVNDSGHTVYLDDHIYVDQLAAGSTAGSSGSFLQDGLSVGVETSFILGGAANASGNYTLNDGLLELWGEARIGDGGTGHLVQNGGEATFAAALINLGNNGGSGVYTLSGGVVTLGTLKLGASTGSSGVLNLNGGVFAGVITKGSGSGMVNFNGGTLKATTGSYFSSFSAGDLILQNGGLVFDTDLQSSVEFRSGLSGSGTLTKRGAGDLAIATASALSGSVVIEEGSLTIFASIFPFAGYSGSLLNVKEIRVKSGAKLSLSAVGDLDLFNDDGTIVLEAGAELYVVGSGETIGVLIANGHVLDLGTYSIAELNALNYGVTFSGSGKLTVTAIPEPSSYGFSAAAGFLGLLLLRRRARSI